MNQEKPRFTKPVAFFWLLRLNRTIMVAAITGAAAFVSGIGASRSLWITLAGWCLAVGGFSLDFYADRDLDVEGPRAHIRHNPFIDYSLSPRTGLVFSITFLIISFVIIIVNAPWSLVPWGIVLSIISGLALHVFEGLIMRALTLGLLQALYVVLGGVAGGLTPALGFLAGTFFFAMFGGRGMIDIRDFPQDKYTRVQTLPQRFGIKRTAQYTAISLCIAYALSLGAYFTGEFSIAYLYLDIVFIAVGLVCAWLFATRPSPKLAYSLTLVFMMGMGSLICLAMILGTL